MGSSDPERFALGLMTTASGDAVEAAILLSDGRDRVRSVGGLRSPCDERLHWGLLEATQNELPLAELLRLERRLTDHFADALEELRRLHPDESRRVEVIGMDGHTLRRLPGEGTLAQIGDPWRLAERTGLPVVSGFRRHDMALGGQGAPLDAMYHWALMACEPRPALMIHFGAVTSLTWLSRSNQIIAGAVGPGMEILQEWVQEVAGVASDLAGEVSAAGRVDDECVRYALTSPFFSRPLPRAPTRSDFERIDVSGLSPSDGAATICAVIAESVVAAIRGLPEEPGLAWVTGPGSEHPVLLEALRAAVPRVANVRERNLNPDTLEVECFAWLAVRHLRGLPVSTPETTGCRVARCGGFLVPPESTN